MSGEPNTNATPPLNRRSTLVETHPKVIPTDFSTVHVDKTMIAIDRGSNTITMTLLQQSLIPQIGGKHEWNLSEEHWKIVGEIKMPMTVMDSMLVYYTSELTSGGVNMIQIVRQYLKDHPPDTNTNMMSYGPTDVR